VKLYVVRHGETEWNKDELFRGRKDVPLNEAGRVQAERAGAYFVGEPVQRVLSSPLGRARQTAEPIGRTTHVHVETREEFTDMAFGIWEGRPLREIAECCPADLALWRNSPEKLRLEAAETLEDVRERVGKGLADATCGAEETIVVVTHRVICKILVLFCLGIPNDHFWDLKFDPGSITLLERTDNRYALIFSNDTCHQKEALTAAHYRDF